MSETVLDAIDSLVDKALEYNQNTLCSPAVLLWPDKEERWQQVIPLLRERRRLVTLGEAQEGVSGPAYWVRCAVAGTVPVDGPDGTPIVYLPGVERDDLRPIEDAPDRVAPIAELQYRGEWFSAPNGRGWTPRSLLTDAERGLGLRIDSEAVSALQHALPELVRQPLARVTGKHWDAADLHELVNPEPLRAMLDWLDDPESKRERMPDDSWDVFRQQCKTELEFDPEQEGALTAAELLGRREGAWAQAWSRFREAPSAYPGIPARLRQARPDDLSLTSARDSWPQDNEEDENRLRGVLGNLPESTPAEARSTVASLWVEHRERRGWVWAELGEAPLVFALEHLTRLAELSAEPTPDGEVEALIGRYSDRGWEVDDASLKALDSATAKEDRAAVATAVDVLYRPWAHEGALKFQEAIGPVANSAYTASPALVAADGVVFVFVDGLRLDLGHALVERLHSAGLKVELALRLAALPTVTQTCKPAVAPIPSGKLGPGPALDAARADSGAKAGIEVLRRLMSDAGVQVLHGDEVGDPSGCAWTEAGQIDRRGHDDGVALVDAVGTELDSIAKRVRQLLDDGWPQVQVVTDHGWLLMPAGMEKVALPAATTEAKKGRCARLKDGAEVEVASVPWQRDHDVRIAVAPGVTCFEEGKKYEHGGISPQECVVPHLSVAIGEASSATKGPEITGFKWLGLLCRIEYSGVGAGGKVDIRGLPSDASTSVAEAAMETTGAGKASLLVPDEDQQGEDAYIVILSASGEPLAQRKVSIGQNR